MPLYISSQSTLKALGHIDTEAGLCIMARAALEKRVEGGGGGGETGRGGEIARMREGSRESVMSMCFRRRGWGCVGLESEAGWCWRWGISQITLG